MLHFTSTHTEKTSRKKSQSSEIDNNYSPRSIIKTYVRDFSAEQQQFLDTLQIVYDSLKSSNSGHLSTYQKAFENFFDTKYLQGRDAFLKILCEKNTKQQSLLHVAAEKKYPSELLSCIFYQIYRQTLSTISPGLSNIPMIISILKETDSNGMSIISLLYPNDERLNKIENLAQIISQNHWQLCLMLARIDRQTQGLEYLLEYMMQSNTRATEADLQWLLHLQPNLAQICFEHGTLWHHAIDKNYPFLWEQLNQSHNKGWDDNFSWTSTALLFTMSLRCKSPSPLEKALNQFNSYGQTPLSLLKGRQSDPNYPWVQTWLTKYQTLTQSSSLKKITR